jgi:rhodanese-related sulfurtransferase
MVVSVTPQQAFELISHGDVEVIDVRNADEWSEGFVPGARLVPLSELRSDWEHSLGTDRTDESGVIPTSERALLFVCAGGVRSQTAGRIAVDHGVSRVYSVIGGTDSWVRAGLPLEHARVAV